MIRLGTGRNSWGVSRDGVSLLREQVAVRPLAVEARPQRIEFDRGASCLVVVDMQNDFCSKGGWLDGVGVDVSAGWAIVGNVKRLAAWARRMGMPVIWLNWGNRPDRANLPPGVLHVYNPDGESCGIGDELAGSGSRVLQEGSWSAALVDELGVAEGDIEVSKYRMSGFFDTPLDSILRNLRVDTLLFAGVNVDQCVYATLADAACLGYDVILVDDCSATTSPSFCADATTYNVAQCYGFVTGLAALEKGAAAS